jgi:hypothetical protein
MFSSGVNLGGGGRSGGLGDMQLALAQTSTGKKTFNNSGLSAGLNLGSFGIDPTSDLQNGDLWFNNINGIPKIRLFGGTYLFNTTGGLIAGRVVGAANASFTEATEISYTSTTYTFGASTNVATSQTITVNGTGNVDLILLAKGTNNSVISSSVFSASKSLNIASTSYIFQGVTVPALVTGISGFKNFTFYNSGYTISGWNGGNPSNASLIGISNIPDGSALLVTATFQGVQTNGTPGSSSFCIKVQRAYRKAGAIFTAMGTTQTITTFNDTGDTFSTAPVLQGSGSASIDFGAVLTTAKTFTTSLKVEIDLTL